MKKLLLIHMVFVSSVIAENGFERVVDNNKMAACKTAKDRAYAAYDIFRINSECFCEQTQTQAWQCDLYFNYIRKKDLAK